MNSTKAQHSKVSGPHSVCNTEEHTHVVDLEAGQTIVYLDIDLFSGSNVQIDCDIQGSDIIIYPNANIGNDIMLIDVELSSGPDAHQNIFYNGAWDGISNIDNFENIQLCVGETFDFDAQSFFFKFAQGGTFYWTVDGVETDLQNNGTASSSVNSVSGIGSIENIELNFSSPGNYTLCFVGSPAIGDCEYSECVDVIVYSDSEAPSFDKPDASIELCIGQDALFSNTSDLNFFDPEKGDFIWIVDDNINDTWNYNSFDLTHDFGAEGDYDITLIYVPDNDVSCNSLAYSETITILQKDPIFISCPSTVCSGSTTTYTVEEGCESYEWIYDENYVSNVEGIGTHELIITWNDFSEFAITELSLITDCDLDYCNPSTIEVPIFPTSSEIIGSDFNCNQSSFNYSVESFENSFYSWSVEPINILEGSLPTLNTSIGSSVMLRNFSGFAGTVKLICQVDNPILGCDFITEKIITYFDVTVTQDVCKEGEINYTIEPLVDTEFQINIFDKDEVLVQSAGFNGLNTYTYALDPLSESNEYHALISLPNGDMCPIQLQTLVINNEMITIQGPDEICEDGEYTYLINCDSGESISWTYTSALGVEEFIDQCKVDLEFDEFNLPGTLSVESTLLDSEGNTCTSDIFSMEIERIDISEFIIDGNQLPCPDGMEVYSTVYNSDATYDWSIDNGLGTIVSGQGTNSIEVSWLNSTATNLANINLNISICGTTYNSNLSIELSPYELLISGPIEACANEELSYTIDSQLSSYDNLVWYVDGVEIEDGNEIFNTTFEEGGTHIVLAMVDTPNGCIGNFSQMLEVFVHESANANVTPSDFWEVCPKSLYQNIILLASDVNVNYTYNWYKNDVLIQSGIGDFEYELTLADVNTNPCNIYVEILTTDGCIEQSAPYDYYYDCDMECECISEPNLNLILSADCSNIFMNGNGINDFSNSNYTILGPDGVDVISIPNPIELNQITAYESPGNYLVQLNTTCESTSSGEQCIVRENATIFVPFVLDIGYEILCAADGQYSLSLYNNSSYAVEPSLVDLEWNVNGSIYTDNELSLIFTQGENVSISLSLTSSDFSCNESIGVNIPLINPFQILNTNNVTCEGSVIELGVDFPAEEIAEILWNFGNDITSNSPTPMVSYSEPGQKNVTAIITDIYGCEHMTSLTFDILSNIIDGLIDVEMMACDATSMLSFANTSSATIVEYQWYFNNEEISSDSEVSVMFSGVYRLVVRDANGCEKSFTTNVNLNAPFPSSIAESASNCGEITLDLQQNSSFAYCWFVSKDGGDFEPLGDQSSYDFQYDAQFNTYEIAVFAFFSDGNIPCEDYDMASINPCSQIAYEFSISPVPEEPIVELTYVSCDPINAMLTVNNYEEIFWSGNNILDQTAKSITTAQNGNYTATYTDPITGCIASVSGRIEKNEVDFSPLLTGCYDLCLEDLENSNLQLMGIEGSFDSWEWRLYESASVFEVLTEGVDEVDELSLSTIGSGEIKLFVSIGMCEYESDAFCLHVENCDCMIVFPDGQGCH